MILYILGFIFMGLFIISLKIKHSYLPPSIFVLYGLISFILGLLKYSNIKFIFMVRYFFYIITGFTMAFIPLILLLVALLIFIRIKKDKHWSWNRLFDLLIVIIFVTIAGLTLWATMHLTQENLSDFISLYSLITMYFIASFISFIFINESIHYVSKDVAYQTLIVLGLQLEQDNQVPKILRRRLDKAISIYKKQVNTYKVYPQIIVTGGVVGNIDDSEASQMKRYLLYQGIPENQIVIEDLALNTNQNLSLSQDLIDRKYLDKPILIVTSRFHLLRTAYLAGQLGMEVSFIGAVSSLKLWPYQIVREYLAYFVLTKEWHVLYILFLIYYSLFMI